jgi:hypothetical protein
MATTRRRCANGVRRFAPWTRSTRPGRQDGQVTSLALTIPGRENDCITIHIVGRMHPGFTDYWDGNWLITPTSVSVGGFKGWVEAGLRCEELERFRQQLRELHTTLTGTAELTSMEDWLHVQLVGDGLGHVAVTGSVMDRPGIGNRLEFTFAIDQTDLPTLIAALDEINQKFPVLGSPP